MIKICKQCGKEFEVEHKSGRPQMYCSEKCLSRSKYLKAGKERAKKYRLDNKGSTFTDCICEQCGKGFKVYGNKKQKYCSKQCYVDSTRFLKEKKCIICGDLFMPKTSSQILCSNKCNTQHQKNIKPKTKYVCHHCGKEYTISHNHKTVYCSRKCAFAAHGKEYNIRKIKSDFNLGVSDRHHRKKAQELGLDFEKIKPIDIYKRDGFKCGICNKKVNEKLRYPNLMCATLDHIIPMSKGGPHTEDNLQCAHFLCNMQKKDSLITYQLRLAI